jgi:hypothetical protein
MDLVLCNVPRLDAAHHGLKSANLNGDQMMSRSEVRHAAMAGASRHRATMRISHRVADWLFVRAV